MNIIDVIKRPIVTEKAVRMKDAQNQYVFAVDQRANKYDIRTAVEKLFRVSVMEVHTVNLHRRPRRSLRGGRRGTKLVPWKKAIVTVKAGQKIELFEGV